MTGSSFETSRIRYTLIITNRSTGSRSFGIRGFFDINVAGNDGAYFWDPVHGWRSDEEAWSKPIPFKYYVVSEVYGGGTRYIYGNVSDSSYGMVPTPPDRLSYAYWGDYSEPFGGGLWCNAWLDCSANNRSVGGTDASVAYWWGYDGTPIVLGPNASFTATTYFFASPEPLYTEEDPGTAPGAIFGVNLQSTVVSEQAVLRYVLLQPQAVRIGLFDATGRVAWEASEDLAGTGELSVPTADIPAGVYYILFEASNGEARVLRFVKR